jgi:hypothetical protein
MLNWLISIVIKPDPNIDPIKELCPGLHWSNRVNPEKFKKKLSFNISYENIKK